MRDPMHFDAHADLYDRARPPYPEALWTRLSELELLRNGIRVIELGAGTGQATGPMSRAGASVTSIEPGTNLADRLRKRSPAATIHVGTLALWRNAFGDPSAAETPFRRRIAAITARRNDGEAQPGPGRIRDRRVDQPTHHRRLLRRHAHRAVHWSIELWPNQVRDLFTTFSNWSATDADEAALAADDLGGWVVEHYVTR